MLQRLCLPALAAAFVLSCASATMAAPAYHVIGQKDINGTTLATRCAAPNARFNFLANGGDPMYGPAGIAIDPRGRIFVTDYGGRRVLTWPNFDALQACAAADGVIGAGELEGPEAVAVDPQTDAVYVADTLSHTVKGYHKVGSAWTRFVTLGAQDVAGDASNRFNFPRGLAVDPGGRLFVADDFNNRILIFDSPFQNGEDAADSIGAGSNGGFSGPKAVAMSGNTLFVADYDDNRVLRFTGPFRTPNQVYVASGVFTGVNSPVDLAVAPDGSLLVTAQQQQRIARFNDAVWTTVTTPTSTFADNIGPEPLGVAADRTGRIYIADYRRYRVLIREERVQHAPITAGANAKVVTLLAQFNSRVGRSVDRVALGQYLRTSEYTAKTNPNGWYADWLKLKQQSLPLPEIMGGETGDLEDYSGFAPNQNAFNELIAHGKAGHIVTLVWHPENPTGGDFSTPVATTQLQNAINDGTPTGKAWQVQLNRAGAVLKQFQAAGVPVVFRPLHEQNGNFFWWGDNGAKGAALRARQQAWVKLWRDLVSDLTVRQGLKNLIFVFGTNQVNYGGVVPPLTYYPGGGSADLVGIDIYDEQLDLGGAARGLRHYAALVGTGKPFGIPEFGQDTGDSGTGANPQSWDARTLTQRIRDSYPRTVFGIAWYSSPNYIYGLGDVAHVKELENDALIDTQ